MRRFAWTLSSYDDPEFYDQLQRARDRGILHLEGSIDALVDTVGALLGVLGAAAALFFLHPVLVPVMLLPLLPGAWGALAAAKIQYAGMSRMVSLTRQAGMYGDLATRRNAAPEIRANQAQAYVLDRFSEAATRVRDHVIAISTSEAKISGIANALAGVGLALSFGAMALMIRAGSLDLALASAAAVAFRTASASLNQLVRRGHELLEKALYIGDFQQFLLAAARQCAPRSGLAVPQTPGVIDIRNLGFRYPGGGWALRDVTITIRAGETIALVGENGSGKTTLAKLIAGLYEPQEGSISWDGVDLRDISPAAVADRISMVLQDPVRWPQSARANVRIGRHVEGHDGEDRLLDAAERSGAMDVIRSLPQGWDTILCREFRGGHDLSAGQWQRLAVARGLYRDAPIVIWDEPTAPLDAKAELAAYEALRRMGAGRTVILITHRLTSVQGADRIILLEQGRLREQGTHKELMARAGPYAHLFAMQMKLHETSAL